MNIVKLQNDLKDLSDQQLLSTMQSGASPQYLVLAEMQRRKKMRDEASTPNEPQAQGTVADEIVGGLTALPVGPMDMASGGLVSFAKGGDVSGYKKGAAEACWEDPETGETRCPPSKPTVEYPKTGQRKEYQEGGMLRLLPADPVADAYTYLQSRGAEIPTDMSEAGIVEYANRVRALDENEVKDTPETQAGFPALFRDYGSGGRGEVMPETQLDTAPQMPMGGGEMAPGFSPVAPTQEGLPDLLAPEGPAPQRAVPFLGQMMEALVPSAQAAEGVPPAQTGEAPTDTVVAEDLPKATETQSVYAQSAGRATDPAEQARLMGLDAAYQRGIEVPGNPGWRYDPESDQYFNPEGRLATGPYQSEGWGKTGTTPKRFEEKEQKKISDDATEKARARIDDYLASESKTSGTEASDALMTLYNEIMAEREAGKDTKERSVNEALMRAGFAMMSSKNPDFLGALGEGGIEGLKAYTEAQKAAAERQEGLTSEARQLLAARELSAAKAMTAQSTEIGKIIDTIDTLQKMIPLSDDEAKQIQAMIKSYTARLNALQGIRTPGEMTLSPGAANAMQGISGVTGTR